MSNLSISMQTTTMENDHAVHANLAQAFEAVCNNTYLFRKHVVDGNGLTYWHLIKSMLSQFDDITFTWQRLNMAQEIEFMNREEFDEAGNTIEGNHFMMQLARLPQNGRGTVRKLMQLALNLGQYRQNQFDCYKLPYITMHTYISADDLVRITSMIDVDILDAVNTVLRAEHMERNIPFYDVSTHSI